MSNPSLDRAINLKKVTYLQLNQVEMDRVLTAFFARLAHRGYTSRLRERRDLTIEQFVEEVIDRREWFTGFGEHRDVVRRWIETHLLDLVNRGKPGQAVAAPRPLHGFTYRFRNPKHSRDYGAAQQLYEGLDFARHHAGKQALEQLHRFFFHGHDPVTGRADNAAVLDVETQAVLRFMEQVDDAPDVREGRESWAPLCVGSADLLAEDIKRLLFYQDHIPRSVMVDYLKILLGFHLGILLLRTMKLLPAMVRRGSADPTCAPFACPMSPRNVEDPQGSCPYRLGMFVDVAGQSGTDVSLLAERSADVHFRRMPTFVRSYYVVKKLDELADWLIKTNKLPRPAGQGLAVGDVLSLLGPDHAAERDTFFSARLFRLTQAEGDEELDPEIRGILDLKLSPMETYIEVLLALHGAAQRKDLTSCLDSLLLKNRLGAMLAQGSGKGAPRSFVLDSRLLEVLLQVAVLREDAHGQLGTAEIRVEHLLRWLRERYGLFIDRLPVGEGFEEPSIDDRRALRHNREAFVRKLREIGFYRDLSDASITQTVTPRYRIAASAPPKYGGRS
jgi:hypothetical protein